jgi:hypothetical protein
VHSELSRAWLEELASHEKAQGTQKDVLGAWFVGASTSFLTTHFLPTSVMVDRQIDGTLKISDMNPLRRLWRRLSRTRESEEG